MVWDLKGDIPLWRALSQEQRHDLVAYLRDAFSVEGGRVTSETEGRITFSPSMFRIWDSWNMVSRCEVELPTLGPAPDAIRYRVSVGLARLMCVAATVLLLATAIVIWVAGLSPLWTTAIILLSGLAWIWVVMYGHGRHYYGSRAAEFIEDQVRAFEAML